MNTQDNNKEDGRDHVAYITGLTDPNSSEVARAVARYYEVVGVPASITTDPGLAFCSVMGEAEVHQEMIGARNPNAQGIVEKNIKKAKEMLKSKKELHVSNTTINKAQEDQVLE